MRNFCQRVGNGCVWAVRRRLRSTRLYEGMNMIILISASAASTHCYPHPFMARFKNYAPVCKQARASAVDALCSCSSDRSSFDIYALAYHYERKLLGKIWINLLSQSFIITMSFCECCKNSDRIRQPDVIQHEALIIIPLHVDGDSCNPRSWLTSEYNAGSVPTAPRLLPRNKSAW